MDAISDSITGSLPAHILVSADSITVAGLGLSILSLIKILYKYNFLLYIF
jgi:hypothetical protein